MQLIPAIDLRDGNCVRLRRGDFASETRYSPSPEALAGRYAAAGAGWLHIVDLDGAREGQPRQLHLVRALAKIGRPRLQVGGGLRDRAAIDAALAAGAGRVVIGSAALTDPAQVAAWLDEVGPDALVLAFDVRIGTDGEARLASHGWREQSEIRLWDAIRPFARAGLRHALCTDIDRDGTLDGPNLALYEALVRRHPEIAWQASGGVRDADDLWSLRTTGVAATVSGRALLEGRVSDQELQPFLPAA